MQETIVITDLTAMGGDGVCIAGVDRDGGCIRPVLPPPGVLRKHLYERPSLLTLFREWWEWFLGRSISKERKLVIYPRVKVRFEFHRVRIELPHVEDLGFDPKSVVYETLCTEAEWEEVLKVSSFTSVQDVYEGHLQENRWVEPGANTRSLGTVSQIKVIMVNLPEGRNGRRYRLHFVDGTGRRYDDITISDMTFRAFCDAEISQHSSPLSTSQHITHLLRGIDRIYLRLGLTRSWASDSSPLRRRCWMQITGIYTFPDYLGGKTFAEL